MMQSEDENKATVWVYVCTWLLAGANHRIVGVEVQEHTTEIPVSQLEHARYAATMGVRIECQRPDALELRAWARKHYFSEIRDTPIPIIDRCAKRPTIRIERIEEREIRSPPPPDDDARRLS